MLIVFHISLSRVYLLRHYGSWIVKCAYLRYWQTRCFD